MRSTAAPSTLVKFKVSLVHDHTICHMSPIVGLPPKESSSQLWYTSSENGGSSMVWQYCKPLSLLSVLNRFISQPFIFRSSIPDHKALLPESTKAPCSLRRTKPDDEKLQKMHDLDIYPTQGDLKHIRIRLKHFSYSFVRNHVH